MCQVVTCDGGNVKCVSDVGGDGREGSDGVGGGGGSSVKAP